MKTISIVSVLMGLMLVNVSAFADDGVVAADQQRINQDKQNIQTDKQDVHNANKAIAQDKASGNTQQLAADREAKKEAKRNERQAKKELKKDRKAKRHDEKKP